MSRRTTAIRLAAMAIESLTATDAGSLQAARDVVDRLQYELTTLSIIEAANAAGAPQVARLAAELGAAAGEG